MLWDCCLYSQVFQVDIISYKTVWTKNKTQFNVLQCISGKLAVVGNKVLWPTPRGTNISNDKWKKHNACYSVVGILVLSYRWVTVLTACPLTPLMTTLRLNIRISELLTFRGNLLIVCFFLYLIALYLIIIIIPTSHHTWCLNRDRGSTYYPDAARLH